MEKSRKFQGYVTQDQADNTCSTMSISCPHPHPLPPPGPCPAPAGKLFQGCISYINSYIDTRVKQLYTKLKQIVQEMVVNPTGATYDYIVLRDSENPDVLHKVYVADGSLRSEPIEQNQEDSES